MGIVIPYLLSLFVLVVGDLTAVALAENIDQRVWINIAIIACGLSVLGGVVWLYVRRFHERPIARL